MFDPAPHLATIYAAMGEPVTPAAGDAFLGIFACADVSTLDDAAQVGDFSLRYPASVGDFAIGAQITVRGRVYAVAEPSRRIGDGRECIVQLVEVPA